jgi:hypothetical protein
MPQVIVAAVVTAGVATGVGLAVGTVTAAAAATYFLTSAATALVLGGVSMALSPTPTFRAPSIPSLSLPNAGGAPISGASFSADQTISIREPIGTHKIVYGRTRVGGTIVYMQGTDSNKYLHIIITIAGHEIDAVEELYFDDELVTLSGGVGYGNKARVQYKLGTDDQTAFTDLVSESGGKWTNDHRLQGVACAYIRLEFDADKFPNGVPNTSFVIRGKKVYDPRTDTTVWSSNSALCLGDYLTNSRYGLGAVYANEIDETQLIAAANICDEDINLAGGGTENRYETNGVCDTSSTPETIINSILTSMAGKAVFSGGKWRIIPGAYYSPTLVFDEDDLRGGLKIQSLVSRRENFNVVKGVFSNKTDNYVVTNFPSVSSATYVIQDNNEEVSKDIELGLTTSASMAQRIAKIDLLRARQQITVSMPLKLQGLKANVGDIVEINNTRMGWNQKPFEVTNLLMAFGETVGVDLELREIVSDVFDWTTDEENPLDPAPNTDLPSAFVVTAPGISISDEIRIVNQQIATVLIVEVSGTVPFQDRYEVQAKKSTDTEFVSMGTSTSNRFELVFVEDSVFYDVRARTVNVLGVRSAYTTGSHQTVGQTAPPADVTNFSVNIIGTEAVLSWTPVADLDLSHYVIRHSRLTTGATYSASITLAAKVARPGNSIILPALTGTYFIKSVDKSGISSVNSTASVAIIDSIAGLNVVETLTENPTFAGTKTQVRVLDGNLLLDFEGFFDDEPGLFDDVTGLFDNAGGDLFQSGEYEFATVVDLGSKYTSRVTADVRFTRVDIFDTFDESTGLFDDREGLFDGSADQVSDANVILLVSVTNDDPAGTPTWSAYRQFVVGDYAARALRFKAELATTSATVTPSISKLEVVVDMPDRVTSGDDILSGTDAGGKVVTFPTAFKVSPALGIAAQNLVSGDFYEIVSKSASGFTIRFKNSGGTVVDRTFDYVAKGYGEAA